MKLCSGDWKNQLKMMNLRVDEYNGRTVGMVNGQYRNVCQFSRNGIWKNIGCLVSDPTFGIGGLMLWEKEEAQEIRVNKRKNHSIRMNIDLHDIFYRVFYYLLL